MKYLNLCRKHKIASKTAIRARQYTNIFIVTPDTKILMLLARSRIQKINKILNLIFTRNIWTDFKLFHEKFLKISTLNRQRNLLVLFKL